MIAVRRFALIGGMLAILAAASGCESPDPNANTPTSGRLVVYADETYAPLIKTLADTFMARSPNAHIEVRSVSARMAVQGLLDMSGGKPGSDSMTSYVSVIGRKLMRDEHDLMNAAELNVKEYIIAYDGVVAVVPTASPLAQTTVEKLRRVMLSSHPIASMLDSSAGSDPLSFLLPDQNSSTLQVVRSKVLGDSDVVAPVHYYSTGDSALAEAIAGNGIALSSWWSAHRDSVRLRALRLGFIDSTGSFNPPTRVHPTTLVMDLYPLKQPLVGYTFSRENSLAVGFLAWLARSDDAQHFLGYEGMQPANVKIRVVVPQSDSE